MRLLCAFGLFFIAEAAQVLTDAPWWYLPLYKAFMLTCAAAVAGSAAYQDAKR